MNTSMWNRFVLQQLVLTAIVAVAILTVSASVPPLRTPIASTLLAVTVFLFLLRPIEREVHSSSRFRTRVLLVGNQPMAQKLIAEIEACPKHRYTILGLVEE